MFPACYWQRLAWRSLLILEQEIPDGREVRGECRVELWKRRDQQCDQPDPAALFVVDVSGHPLGTLQFAGDDLPCGPFGDYRDDPFSRFFSLDLGDQSR